MELSNEETVALANFMATTWNKPGASAPTSLELVVFYKALHLMEEENLNNFGEQRRQKEYNVFMSDMNTFAHNLSAEQYLNLMKVGIQK